MGKSINRKTCRPVNFVTETYNEDEGRKEHLATVLLSGITNICWITHDKDTHENGEPKKPHTHAVIRVPNSMSISAFSKKYAIQDRLVQPCVKGDEIEDLDMAFLYMIHADNNSKNLGKFQYSPKDIKGPWAEYARQRISKICAPGYKAERSAIKESRSFIQILDYIDNSLYVSMTDLSRWAASSGHWSAFRRSSGIIRDVIKEHNSYLEKIQLEKEREKWQEDLERRQEIESVYEAIGYRALKTLDLQFSRAGLPSLKLQNQIKFIDDEIARNGGKKGGVNVALIKEMLRKDDDPLKQAK